MPHPLSLNTLSVAGVTLALRVYAKDYLNSSDAPFAVSLLSFAALGFLLLGRLLRVSLGALLVSLFPSLQNEHIISQRGKADGGKTHAGMDICMWCVVILVRSCIDSMVSYGMVWYGKVWLHSDAFLVSY